MIDEQIISIDNVNYPVSSLTEQAKILLSNIQFTDTEISRLGQLIAVTKTARGSYVQALKAEMQSKNVSI